MHILSRTLALLVLLLSTGLAPNLSQAQVLELRAYRVTFPPGSIGTTIRETITGPETILYRVSARRGQVMQITLDASSSLLFFSVYGPGRNPGDTPMARSNAVGDLVPALNQFRASLARDGDYTVALTLAPAPANRGDRVPFRLVMNVTSGAVQLPGGPSVSNDLPKPGFMTVSGLRAGDRLNVRSGPSTSNRVLYALVNGTGVTNLGCERNSSGVVWCRIHPMGQPGLLGWASALYLTSARDPGSATNLPSVPPPAAPTTATGTIFCVQERVPLECRFRVTRRGNGNATLTVSRLFNRDRVIEFEAGRPVSSNASTELFGEWRGDDVIVTIGPRESYTVPNAVLFGG